MQINKKEWRKITWIIYFWQSNVMLVTHEAAAEAGGRQGGVCHWMGAVDALNPARAPVLPVAGVGSTASPG